MSNNRGEQRQQSEGELTRYVGFTQVQVRAINPTREQLNKLLDREPKDDDKEFTYTSEDDEGNKRVRLTFWLYSEDKDKFFPYSFNLTNKEVISKDKTKTQYINSTCTTTWVDDEKNLPSWFKQFESKEKGVRDAKTWRKAILGEAELGIFLKSWLGRLNLGPNYDKVPGNLMIDTAKLLREDYSELREFIEGDFDTPFIALTGVRTDPDDTQKQYQQVYGKAFLPSNFYKYILKGNKFPSGYAQNTWDKFEKEVTGEHGFKAYFELVPLCDYNREKDPSVSETTQKTEGVTAINPRF